MKYIVHEGKISTSDVIIEGDAIKYTPNGKKRLRKAKKGEFEVFDTKEQLLTYLLEQIDTHLDEMKRHTEGVETSASKVLEYKTLHNQALMEVENG